MLDRHNVRYVLHACNVWGMGVESVPLGNLGDRRAWGSSQLAKIANNIFGRKVWAPGPEVLELPTKEFLKGEWVVVNAFWEIFPSFTAAFEDRMAILRNDPRYEKALKAANGPTYLTEVSKVWSTDPNRARSVQVIWTNHHALFAIRGGGEEIDPFAAIR